MPALAMIGQVNSEWPEYTFDMLTNGLISLTIFSAAEDHCSRLEPESTTMPSILRPCRLNGNPMMWPSPLVWALTYLTHALKAWPSLELTPSPPRNGSLVPCPARQ